MKHRRIRKKVPINNNLNHRSSIASNSDNEAASSDSCMLCNSSPMDTHRGLDNMRNTDPLRLKPQRFTPQGFVFPRNSNLRDPRNNYQKTDKRINTAGVGQVRPIKSSNGIGITSKTYKPYDIQEIYLSMRGGVTNKIKDDRNSKSTVNSTQITQGGNRFCSSVDAATRSYHASS